MPKYINLILVLLTLLHISCSPIKNPTLEDKWRLVSVDRLSYPDTSSIKEIFYPSEPQESNSLIFSHDSNYQEWTWKDSCSIEFQIIFENELKKSIETIGYFSTNDSIYFSNATYGFEISNNELILKGWGESSLGIKEFIYHFILVN